MITDSYANYPRSVNELRSHRSGNAADWSPREMLISLLRDMDSGRIKPESMVVAFRERLDTGYRTDFHAACPDATVMTGLLETAKFLVWRGIR
jgi:hypothetical protein